MLTQVQVVEAITNPEHLEHNLTRALIESSLDCIFSFDKDMYFTVWNPSIVRLSGKESSEILGKHVFDVFPNVKTTHRLLSLYRRVLNGETIKVSDEEFTYLTTGEKGFYEGTWAPIVDKEKGVVGGLGIVRDITQKKYTETEQQLFFNSSLDLIAVTDSEGQVLKANPTLQKLLGYSMEELRSSLFHERIHPEDLQPALGAIRKLSSGSPHEYLECRSVCKDGSFRWIGWKATLINSRIYASGRDITEERESAKRKEKQRELSLYSARLVALGELSSGLAREINNPLQIIQLHSDLIRDFLDQNYPDPQAMESIESLQTAICRIAKTVKNLATARKN